MSRNSMLTGRNTENFSYDSLGRLVRTYTPHNRQTSLVEYTTNGNIASKTGVGSYYYESSRPHAVTMVDNTDSIVSTIPQYVTYTPFNKVQTVTQGDYELAITYGPDQQRNKTTLSRNDTLLYTRYYADNYEEVHSGNNVYYYYYIHTPDGLTNVAEKKNSTITVYSAETDYLGSIASLYNRNGQKVFRAEYDAWGKQNVVTDSLARFQRGYCGHEHWQEFGLIDMNGRMYDPVIARFLSPDPFVQAPEDLQNYNRYSYCLNNPLKYTDPSGEYWLFDDLIVGAIGGTINLVSNALQGNLGGSNIWNSIGRGAAAFAAGAASSVASMYPQFGGSLIGGAIMGATNAWLGGASSASDLLRNAGIGAVSGFVGGTAGQWAGNGLGGVVINGFQITSPTLKGAVAGFIGGAVGGYVGGTTAGLIMTGDFATANHIGLQSIASGAITGTISGSAGAIVSARKNSINPWNGKPKKSFTIGEGMTTDPQKGWMGVDQISKDLGSDYYRPDNSIPKEVKGYGTSPELMYDNAVQIEIQMQENIIIYDRGPVGNGSPYYNMEQGRTMNYNNVYNVKAIYNKTQTIRILIINKN